MKIEHCVAQIGRCHGGEPEVIFPTDYHGFENCKFGAVDERFCCLIHQLVKNLVLGSVALQEVSKLFIEC